MSKVARDEVRENRIADEAIVDAYGPEEQAIGWYYYLDDKMSTPFKAKCVEIRSISPLQIDEKIQVMGMAPEIECEHEMVVLIEWQGRKFGVPLAQLVVVDGDEETHEAIEDWHYWVNRGYVF